MNLRLASYNIHAGVGSDQRFNPRRLAGVLQRLGADIIALQEVVSVGTDGFALLDELAHHCGMQAIAGPTMKRKDADYGNALLLRCPWRKLRKLEFDVSNYEPRGALSLEIGSVESPVTIATTHLGLRRKERKAQIGQLLDWLPDPPAQVVLLGDLNEWWPWSGNLRRLYRHLGMQPSSPATFPARLPLFKLDRILASPPDMLQPPWHLNEQTARDASDHLPLVAQLTISRA